MEPQSAAISSLYIPRVPYDKVDVTSWTKSIVSTGGRGEDLGLPEAS